LLANVSLFSVGRNINEMTDKSFYKKLKNNSTAIPRIKLTITPIKEMRPNLNVFEKASQRAIKEQTTKRTIAYVGTMLVKSPIVLKIGSNNAVNPNNAKVKFDLGCLTNR